MNRKLYPKNWNAIALEIKEEVEWKCEQCGKQCRRNRESWEEFFADWDLLSDEFAEAIDHKQRFTLTVSHMDHVPSNCDRSNLRALCTPCHLKYDVKEMAKKKRLKKEREGQISLLDTIC